MSWQRGPLYSELENVNATLNVDKGGDADAVMDDAPAADKDDDVLEDDEESDEEDEDEMEMWRFLEKRSKRGVFT